MLLSFQILFPIAVSRYSLTLPGRLPSLHRTTPSTLEKSSTPVNHACYFSRVCIYNIDKAALNFRHFLFSFVFVTHLPFSRGRPQVDYPSLLTSCLRAVPDSVGAWQHCRLEKGGLLITSGVATGQGSEIRIWNG